MSDKEMFLVTKVGAFNEHDKVIGLVDSIDKVVNYANIERIRAGKPVSDTSHVDMGLSTVEVGADLFIVKRLSVIGEGAKNIVETYNTLRGIIQSVGNKTESSELSFKLGALNAKLDLLTDDITYIDKLIQQEFSSRDI